MSPHVSVRLSMSLNVSECLYVSVRLYNVSIYGSVANERPSLSPSELLDSQSHRALCYCRQDNGSWAYCYTVLRQDVFA